MATDEKKEITKTRKYESTKKVGRSSHSESGHLLLCFVFSFFRVFVIHFFPERRLFTGVLTHLVQGAPAGVLSRDGSWAEGPATSRQLVATGLKKINVIQSNAGYGPAAIG